MVPPFSQWVRAEHRFIDLHTIPVYKFYSIMYPMEFQQKTEEYSTRACRIYRHRIVQFSVRRKFRPSGRPTDGFPAENTIREKLQIYFVTFPSTDLLWAKNLVFLGYSLWKTLLKLGKTFNSICKKSHILKNYVYLYPIPCGRAFPMPRSKRALLKPTNRLI